MRIKGLTRDVTDDTGSLHVLIRGALFNDTAEPPGTPAGTSPIAKATRLRRKGCMPAASGTASWPQPNGTST